MSPQMRIPAWFLSGAVGVALLAIVAANVPERARLLGLFPIAVGCLAGWGFARIAREIQVPMSRTLLALTWLLVAAGQIGAVVIVYRQRVERLQQNLPKDPLAEATRQLLAAEPEPGESEEIRAHREEIRESVRRSQEARRERLSLPMFLRDRVSALGTWPAPWPAVFWAAEIFLAASTGTFVASRLSRRDVEMSIARGDGIH